MPYTTPSTAEFKARYPVFAAVGDSIVASSLVEGASHVSTSWIEADYQVGLMLYAAHVMTLDGLGTSSEAQLGQFKSLGIGRLSLTRTDNVAPGVLGSTSYGRRYKALLARNSPGMLAVT